MFGGLHKVLGVGNILKWLAFQPPILKVQGSLSLNEKIQGLDDKPVATMGWGDTDNDGGTNRGLAEWFSMKMLPHSSVIFI
ncbi:MAG: hypothetical protein IH828_02845 [Nitrospinae bacterium]|nr:hypothetical protein [Nitrospinota bacterium]